MLLTSFDLFKYSNVIQQIANILKFAVFPNCGASFWVRLYIFFSPSGETGFMENLWKSCPLTMPADVSLMISYDLFTSTFFASLVTPSGGVAGGFSTRISAVITCELISIRLGTHLSYLVFVKFET